MKYHISFVTFAACLVSTLSYASQEETINALPTKMQINLYDSGEPNRDPLWVMHCDPNNQKNQEYSIIKKTNLKITPIWKTSNIYYTIASNQSSNTVATEQSPTIDNTNFQLLVNYLPFAISVTETIAHTKSQTEYQIHNITIEPKQEHVETLETSNENPLVLLQCTTNEKNSWYAQYNSQTQLYDLYKPTYNAEILSKQTALNYCVVYGAKQERGGFIKTPYTLNITNEQAKLLENNKSDSTNVVIENTILNVQKLVTITLAELAVKAKDIQNNKNNTSTKSDGPAIKNMLYPHRYKFLGLGFIIALLASYSYWSKNHATFMKA